MTDILTITRRAVFAAVVVITIGMPVLAADEQQQKVPDQSEAVRGLVEKFTNCFRTEFVFSGPPQMSD